jgi:hypothetical protein
VQLKIGSTTGGPPELSEVELTGGDEDDVDVGPEEPLSGGGLG